MLEQHCSWLNIISVEKTMANAALAVIRPVIRVGSHLAPRLAGRIAFDLFCRPGLAGGLTADQKKTVEAAEKRLAAAERLTVSHLNGYVETYTFRQPPGAPSRGTVLLLHGWTGRAAFMAGFIPHLMKEGFDVTALDLPGHGRSSGKRLNMPLAMEALSAVRRALGPIHGIVGHSFGGAVAVTAAAGVVPAFAPLKVKRLALVAAPDKMSTYFRGFGGMIGLSARGQSAMEDRVQDIAATALDRFDGTVLLPQLAVPTLVVHDREDKEIPFADAQSLASGGGPLQLMPVEGLGHRRILQSKEVARAVARHMAAE
jgi:pimeloyl-ACP methyl ester carboxylesterase